ncbi:MAG TPA: HEPN domain-containing protein [Candidatus Wallbacteria bacterium]|nr:MAG: HEPN domain protein [bacterium ADurb.Bin243]HOD39754.1 HEPN domain-containing protein [Candidatus Wallbacteria bacterium]HPG57824.1 HEPN domain-containing protein [Candidatus Wallbacteria bacterium]
MNAEAIKIWLKKSKSNLTIALEVKKEPDILYEDLCFEAQQSAEKALKALLLFYGAKIEKTHSIEYLLKLIEQNGNITIPEYIKEAAILTDYAVTTRYPGDWEPVDEAEYLTAVKLAGDVYDWVSEIVGPVSG